MKSVNLHALLFFLAAAVALSSAETCQLQVSCSNTSKIKVRRYDVRDLGYPEKFHGWADVQGQGAANDYCRVVSSDPTLFLSCALAGTHGQDEHNYKSTNKGLDLGYPETSYMRDMDGDGRDDFCRCVGNNNPGNNIRVECMKAGERGFYGSEAQGGSQFTFSPTGPDANCESRMVRPEFGYSQWR